MSSGEVLGYSTARYLANATLPALPFHPLAPRDMIRAKRPLIVEESESEAESEPTPTRPKGPVSWRKLTEQEIRITRANGISGRFGAHCETEDCLYMSCSSALEDRDKGYVMPCAQCEDEKCEDHLYQCDLCTDYVCYDCILIKEESDDKKANCRCFNSLPTEQEYEVTNMHGEVADTFIGRPTHVKICPKHRRRCEYGCDTPDKCLCEFVGKRVRCEECFAVLCCDRLPQS